jgi:hypothetical protein
MNRWRIILCAVVTVTLTRAALATGAEPTTAPAEQVQATVETKASKLGVSTLSNLLSRTRYARRVLSVPLDRSAPDWVQLSRRIDDSASKLAPQILNLPAEQAGDALEYRGEFGNDRADLVITINVPDDEKVRPAAREFADQLVNDLQIFVTDSRDHRARDEAQPNEDAVEKAQATYEKSFKNFKDLQLKLRDKTGRLDVSPQHIAEAASRLDQERLKLEVEQAAKGARREALASAVADASKRMEEKVKGDRVAAELAKVVELRERVVARARKAAEAGQASSDEVDRAAEALAEARAKLIERQQAAADQAGGDVLGSWNRELLSLSVDERELVARLEQVQTRLKSMRALVDSMEDLRRMQEELERSRAALADAQQRLKRTMERLRQIEQTQRLLIREADDRRDSPPSPKEKDKIKDKEQGARDRDEAMRQRAEERQRFEQERAERDRERADRDRQRERERAELERQRQREREQLMREQPEEERANRPPSVQPSQPPQPKSSPTTQPAPRRPRIQRGDAQ